MKNPSETEGWRNAYYRTAEGGKVKRTAPQMAGELFVQTPTVASDVVPKSYVDSSTGSGSVALFHPFAPGRWYGGNLTSDYSTVLAWLRPEARVSPFFLATSATFDRFGLDVTTAGGAGCIARCGIYEYDGDTLLPASLLYELGTIDLSSTGRKYIILSSPITLSGSLGLVVQVENGTTNPTIIYDQASYWGAPSTIYGFPTPDTLVSTNIWDRKVYSLRSIAGLTVGSLPAASFWTYDHVAAYGSGLMLRTAQATTGLFSSSGVIIMRSPNIGTGVSGAMRISSTEKYCGFAAGLPSAAFTTYPDVQAYLPHAMTIKALALHMESALGAGEQVVLELMQDGSPVSGLSVTLTVGQQSAVATGSVTLAQHSFVNFRATTAAASLFILSLGLGYEASLEG